MGRNVIMDVVGLVKHEEHQLKHFLEGRYTEHQLAGVRKFRNEAFQRPPGSRQAVVALWDRHVPGRGEGDLLAMFRAMRQDGFDGPIFTLVLGG